MTRRPPRSTRTDTLFPYTTLFRSFNLFPQMTARENVAFGPRQVRGASKEEALEQAAALLAKVGLADRGHHYPSELSGGQQQRVAIARALAVKPKLMLRSEEHTSELQSLMRISYAVFCLKKKTTNT